MWTYVFQVTQMQATPMMDPKTTKAPNAIRAPSVGPIVMFPVTVDIVAGPILSMPYCLKSAVISSSCSSILLNTICTA